VERQQHVREENRRLVSALVLIIASVMSVAAIYGALVLTHRFLDWPLSFD